jgi:signal transduction histidine kinase
VHDELEEVAAASRRLARLVSDMLDMARIEGGAIDLRLDRVDLREAVDAAVARLRLVNPERRVEVRIAPGTPEVRADWDRLGQVIDNLLANADHFAPPGTAITVAAEPNSGDAVVRIVDEGPGVAPELRERIFERFVRGTGGTGLGLPIVRGLVTAQGGKVWLEESAPGEGGRFAFSLPSA